MIIKDHAIIWSTWSVVILTLRGQFMTHGRGHATLSRPQMHNALGEVTLGEAMGPADQAFLQVQEDLESVGQGQGVGRGTWEISTFCWIL